MRAKYIGNGSFRFGDRPLSEGEIVEGPIALIKALTERGDFEEVKESTRRKRKAAEEEQTDQAPEPVEED